MKPFNWTCPFCNQPTTITEPNHDDGQGDINLPTKDGLRVITYLFIACPIPECRRLAVRLTLFEAKRDQYNRLVAETMIKKWSLIPGGTARPFPDYIPPQILANYSEACEICDLSPKASATLCRRCLQGMIRDF